MPVWPDDPASEFNEGFFEDSPNVLTGLLPGCGEYEDLAKVIDVPAATGGLKGVVVTEPQGRRAILYLKE